MQYFIDPQAMFMRQSKKNSLTPLNPTFPYIKCGFEGVYFTDLLKWCSDIWTPDRIISLGRIPSIFFSNGSTCFELVLKWKWRSQAEKVGFFQVNPFTLRVLNFQLEDNKSSLLNLKTIMALHISLLTVTFLIVMTDNKLNVFTCFVTIGSSNAEC